MGRKELHLFLAANKDATSLLSACKCASRYPIPAHHPCLTSPTLHPAPSTIEHHPNPGFAHDTVKCYSKANVVKLAAVDGVFKVLHHVWYSVFLRTFKEAAASSLLADSGTLSTPDAPQHMWP